MNNTYEFITNLNNETHTTNWNNVAYEHVEDQIEQLPDELPPAVMIVLIVAGIIGNCLVILAIMLDRKLQNLTNYFLLSLAVTDLLVSILILPGRLITARYMFEPSTFPLCFLYLVGDDFVTAASAIHICFISLERYFAIRYPLVRNLTKKRNAIKIGLVWVIAALTVIPYMTFAIITEHSNKPEFCPDLLANFKHFETIVFFESLVIVIMVVVVVVSFILTTIHLRRLVKQQERNKSNADSGLVRTVGSKMSNNTVNKKVPLQMLQSEEKALKVVWLVSFAFIICMLPYTCTSLQFYFFPEVIIPPILLEMTAYLNYFNSVINPIIYTIFNKTFRENFKNLILLQVKKDT